MADASRREFVKGAALGAASLVVPGTAPPAEAAPAPPRPAVVVPTEAQAQIEFGAAAATAGSPRRLRRGVLAAQAPAPAAAPASVHASDFMVDVLKTLDFEYAAINPGSAFQGLHESLVNYGHNTMPEILTCLHEESAVAMAHGYAKAAGKPMLVVVHATPGLLHASMALFQAWADRVPVILIVGQHRNPTGVVNRPHSAQDMGALVRDYVKFDDETTTLERFAESAMRAYRIAMTPPMGPVALVVDSALQESRMADRSGLRIPALTLAAPPQGDANAVREAARLLVNAETPLIQAHKIGRTPRAWDLMLELAEALQAPVDVGTYGSWQTFPSWHRFYGTGGPGYTPDVTLGLEVSDMSAAARAARAGGRKTISISAEHLFQGSNIHDFGRYADVDLVIAADAEATLPALIEEFRRAMTPGRRTAAEARGARIAAAHKEIQTRAIQNARYGWESAPVSVPRLIAELGEQIKNDDWAIVSGHQFTGDWQRRLLNFDKPHRYNGDCGGFGIGYDTPASVGAALANKRLGRLSIGIVGDGDLNFGPGVLWTAVHHRIPLLLVVHNNRAYQAEVMIIQRMAGSRGRGSGRSHIGTTITDPDINHAQLARSYGMYSEGPIADPKDLAGAYQRALAKVRAGEPALVDVISQPR
ncbi:MAG: thiamine pyrophosphate-binding protein [Acidobacteria bacterium]|nr:thiamine pyrophosphate-binding protein [Acidobacteriota bacterium]